MYGVTENSNRPIIFIIEEKNARTPFFKNDFSGKLVCMNVSLKSRYQFNVLNKSNSYICIYIFSYISPHVRKG